MSSLVLSVNLACCTYPIIVLFSGVCTRSTTTVVLDLLSKCTTKEQRDSSPFIINFTRHRHHKLFLNIYPPGTPHLHTMPMRIIQHLLTPKVIVSIRKKRERGGKKKRTNAVAVLLNPQTSICFDARFVIILQWQIFLCKKCL